MSDRVFIDTNVLVYALDEKYPRKQEIATSLLLKTVTSGKYSISTQVLQEFFAIVTRKLSPPLSAEKAVLAIEHLSSLSVVIIDVPLVLSAAQLTSDHPISFWDSLIVQAAQQGNCSTLLTEGLQHGQTIAGVTVCNPFLSE